MSAALTPRALRDAEAAAAAAAKDVPAGTDGPALTPRALRDRAAQAEAAANDRREATSTKAPVPPTAPSPSDRESAPSAGAPAPGPDEATAAQAGAAAATDEPAAPQPRADQPGTDAPRADRSPTAPGTGHAPASHAPRPTVARKPPAAPAARSTPRVAIVAHSHPRHFAGGGEVAAWRQFDALRQLGVDTWFLGVVPGDDGRLLGGGPGHITAFGERDLCMRGLPMNAFAMEQPTQAAEDHLVGLLDQMAAQVYHFHHVWNVGAGTVRRLRALRPDATFVLTLHELATICALDGQMVKSTGALCFEAGPLACANCLSGRSPLSVSVRRARMLEVLALMDVLIAPSRFVATRLEEWGVPPGRIRVIENGLPEALIDPARTVPGGAEADILSRRFAFFGNATPTKGLGVLVEAAILLAENASSPPVTIEVHGVDAATLGRMVPGMPLPRLLVPRGRYRPHEAVSLMRRQGWVIVPSTWWENAPVVIDEARAAVRPVIASDIGGMAEKTAGWGLQFPVGDATGLAALIAAIAGDGRRWGAIAAGVPSPTPLGDSLAQWAEACALTLPVGGSLPPVSPEPPWPKAAQADRAAAG